MSLLGMLVPTIVSGIVGRLIANPLVPGVTNQTRGHTQIAVEQAVREEVVPRMEHLSNREPWYQSRVTIGALASIASGIAAMVGFQLDVQYVTEMAIAAGPILGGLLSLYGRWKAKKPLGA